MVLPKAPSWFKRKLSLVSPSLTVFFNVHRETWEIAEKVPSVVSYGIWNGIHIQKVQLVNHKIMHIESLGSDILRLLNRQKNSRFKSFKDFYKENKLRDWKKFTN